MFLLIILANFNNLLSSNKTKPYGFLNFLKVATDSFPLIL